MTILRLLLVLVLMSTALVQRAESGVVWVPIQFGVPAGNAGVDIDLVTRGVRSPGAIGGPYDFTIFRNGGLAGVGGGAFDTQNLIVATASSITSLPVGTLVDGSGASHFPEYRELSEFYGKTGFFGIRFYNESLGAFNNGWVRLRISSDVSQVLIEDWAYETDPNTAIAVGSAPEPGTWMTMLAGLAALAAVRLRRRA